MKSCFLILFAAILHQEVNAQQATVPAGGNDIGSGGSSSWSIGQPVYTSSQGSQGNMNQGVQQPYEFFPVGVFSQKKFSLECIVYPNPTVSLVLLEYNDNDDRELTYEVFDLNGKKILSGQINTSRTQIDLAPFSPGTYMLSVKSMDHQQSVFRIIKN